MSVKKKLENFSFSQSALHIFQLCQLKFKKRYLDNLYWSQKELFQPEQRTAMEQGILFHLLAQRYFNCLPTGIEDFPAGQLQDWLALLKKFLPWEEKKKFWPEYQLTLDEGGRKLTAKYDLVVWEGEQLVTIYDWKTEKRRLEKEKAAKSWQTILYRYLLVEAGQNLLGRAIKPEEVRMIYWNPLYPQTPVELLYSSQLYEQDKQILENLLQHIFALEENGFLPTTKEKVCPSCEYSYFCQKGSIDYSHLLGEDDLDESLVWEGVEEYPY